MAAAVLGDENMLYMFYDEPELMKDLLELGTQVYLDFLASHHANTPPFAGGWVVGIYYLWTPGKNARLQEDAMALLSPDLYEEFVHPCDTRIAKSAEYTVFHLHATGLFLLDFLLDNEGLNVLQVSKDEGVELPGLIKDLQRIQEAGRCLILKGRFTADDLQTVKRELDYRGLCIEAVVENPTEAEAVKQAF